MSISRVPIGSASGTANNQFHGQGQFCYYRKGSAVSGVTDVAVYVDSAYMGLMSPTEHFSLNTKGTFWEFKPVDPLLVGEFVLADTAEEYGSSAVAGSVTIAGGSVAISNDLSLTSLSNAFSAANYFGSLTGTYFYLCNPKTTTKTAYVKSLLVRTSQLADSISIELGTYTGADPANLSAKSKTVGAADGVCTLGGTAPGTASATKVIAESRAKQYETRFIFAEPICLPDLGAGTGCFLGVNISLPASGNGGITAELLEV